MNAQPSRRTVMAAAGSTTLTAGLIGSAPQAAAAPVLAPPVAPSTPAGGADWQTCLAVARAILVLDENNRPLTPAYTDILLRKGLPRGGVRRKVLVIGAGPAGMVAAHLLREAGHHVTVLEANANRVGGRIKTFRTGGHENADQPFADPAQYAEAGAMRIPDSHPLVTGLMEALGLERRRFHLIDIDASGKPANRTWIHVNGIRARRSDYQDRPRRINRSFGVPARHENTPAADLLRAALAPARALVDGKSGRELVEGWARVLHTYGHWSMYRYLKERAGLDENTIDLIGTVQNLTSRLHLSFLHSFLSAALISPGTAFYELPGGTATLVDALYEQVRDLVHLDRRAVRIDYRPGGGVTVHTVSESRTSRPVTEEFTGDEAIITVPFSGLRHVTFTPAISYRKRRAITELHYDAATKVLLEFSRRWWEFSEQDWKHELDAVRPGLYEAYRAGKAPTDGSLLGAHPSVPEGQVSERQRIHYAAHRSPQRNQPEAARVIGGGSITDNPNRFIYEPSHPVPGSPGGVLLASYTWSDDALKWDAYDDEERYPLALTGVQEVYGQRTEIFYTGKGRTQSWMRDPYAYGEASVLLPGQHTELFPDIPASEGPLHFAGCHTSLKPAWIEGALESAIRTALKVHTG